VRIRESTLRFRSRVSATYLCCAGLFSSAASANLGQPVCIYVFPRRGKTRRRGRSMRNGKLAQPPSTDVHGMLATLPPNFPKRCGLLRHSGRRLARPKKRAHCRQRLCVLGQDTLRATERRNGDGTVADFIQLKNAEDGIRKFLESRRARTAPRLIRRMSREEFRGNFKRQNAARHARRRRTLILSEFRAGY